jgi:hypothetical protein
MGSACLHSDVALAATPKPCFVILIIHLLLKMEVTIYSLPKEYQPCYKLQLLDI